MMTTTTTIYMIIIKIMMSDDNNNNNTRRSVIISICNKFYDDIKRSTILYRLENPVRAVVHLISQT